MRPTLSSPRLASLVRSVLTESASEGDIPYGSRQELYDALRPLVVQVWEGVRESAIRRFPSHAVVLGRTRFVPLFTSRDSRPSWLKMGSSGIVNAEFVSQCDDLFATTRAGTRCRASGNLADPPTHNAVYLDVVRSLGLDGLPPRGSYRWRGVGIEDTLMHEIAHAVDSLSSVVRGEQIRDSQDTVVGDIFDPDALGDKRHFMDQVEDRLIRSGASDDGIDRFLLGASRGWDHYVDSGWLRGRAEQVAILIQLVSYLDSVGVPASDFLRMDFEDPRLSAASAGLIDWALVCVLYGLIDEEGVIGLEGIRGEIE